eukprot:7389702-Prymnesium_polylepis.1
MPLPETNEIPVRRHKHRSKTGFPLISEESISAKLPHLGRAVGPVPLAYRVFVGRCGAPALSCAFTQGSDCIDSDDCAREGVCARWSIVGRPPMRRRKVAVTGQRRRTGPAKS